MAHAPQTSIPSTDSPPYFGWDADPVVVVSRRPRVVSFPGILLEREPTASDLKMLRNGQNRSMPGEQRLTISGGVTFLGAHTTAFALRAVPGPGQAPRGAPPEGDLRIVVPETTASNDLQRGVRVVDRESRRVVPARVHEALLRVLDWLRREEEHLRDEKGVQPILFTADDGFDPEGPEVAVMPLSEVFEQRTDRGRHAYAATQKNIAWAKNGTHLGALHDYAVRNPGGWLLAQEARARVQRAPGLLGGVR